MLKRKFKSNADTHSVGVYNIAVAIKNIACFWKQNQTEIWPTNQVLDFSTELMKYTIQDRLLHK